MQGLKLIGFTAAGVPVYSVTGGAPEDGSEGEEDDPAGQPDGGEGEGEADDYVPPSREEYERMTRALKKANTEAAQRRRWLDEHGIDPRNGKAYDAEEGEDGDPQPRTQATQPKPKPENSAEEDVQAGRRISEEDFAALEKQRRVEGKRAAQREASLTRALAKKATAAALAEAGWNGKGAQLIERMIDLGEIEVDDEGEVIGLADQIADVKNEMPEWFRRTRAAAGRPANGSGAREVDGADKAAGNAKPKPKDKNGWLTAISQQIDGVAVE